MPRTTTKRSSATAPAATRWLDADDEATWRALATVMVKLPWALECQLQRDAGLSFLEYYVLARLSEDPHHTVRMSTLAEVTNSSLSRLSHLMKRLEARELVRREPDPTDGRFTNAVLTKIGYTKLVASAPAHVGTVRSLVFDPLSAKELRQLQDTCRRLLDRIEAANG